MVPRREDSPHVPQDPREIADQVGEAALVGITVVHLHARDAEGMPTHDPEVFARIIEAIRASHPELVICVSLSGRHRNDFESRAAPLQLEGAVKPDMASLTLASMNFSRDASITTPDMVGRLAREMLVRGVAPELEVFDTGMVNYARFLAARGLLRGPFYFNLILGNAASAQADPLTLGAMVSMLLQPNLWAAGGIGRAQTTAHALALAAGGGVRTGLEDNLFLDRARTTLATNVQLVRRAHQLAGALERPVMTSAEFRTVMGLGTGHGSYGRPPAEAPNCA
jgi:3-keto-5-aminohexanoate cleavage enzyme